MELASAAQALCSKRMRVGAGICLFVTNFTNGGVKTWL